MHIASAIQPAPADSRRKLVSWGVKGGFAIVEYGFVSGTNFVIGIVLARWMRPDQYGSYAIAFTGYLLAHLLYQALVLEPMMVYGASEYRDALPGYLKKVLLLHLGVTFAAAGVLAGCAVVMRGSGVNAAGAFAGLALATPFLFVFWLVRRVFYLRLNPAPAAFGALVYFALAVGMVFVLRWFHAVTPFTTFAAIGLAALVTGVIMLVMLRSLFLGVNAGPDMRTVWRQHWRFGSWSFASSLTGWVQGSLYMPLISTLGGLPSAAALRAVMNFTAPLAQTYAALSMLLLPFAAGNRQAGKQERATAFKISMLFVGGAIAYWSVILPFRSQVLHTLYAGKYTAVTHVLPVFAVESILLSAFNGPSIIFRARKRPAAVFCANCAAAALSLLAGIPLMRTYGVAGAGYGMVVSDIMALSVVTYLLLGRNPMNTLQHQPSTLRAPMPQSAMAPEAGSE